MARFSSVAYEDPPKTKKNTMMAGIEQFVDNYDVSITRPIRDNSSRISHDRMKGAAENNNNTWNMAHLEAMSPRPLMLMLSGCNTLGMSETDTRSFETAQFQWVALATSQNTSAQFDAWRIISSAANNNNNATKEVDGSVSDAILVIAFRGTTTYLDLLADIQLKQDMISCSDFGDVCMDNNNALVDDSLDDSDGSKLMAHSGFLQSYSSIRSSLLHLLSDNAGTYDQIWFTGHSLGAALATLAVVDVGSIMNNVSQPISIKSMNPSSSSPPTTTQLNLPKVKKLSSYLFGTPRVGNRVFADRLARLQRQPEPTIQEYYRINTPGDAVVFLPRGKVVNRLDIDYVHAGASVFLPTLSSDDNEETNTGTKNGSDARQGKTKESYSRWMMQLEDDTIEQINQRIFKRDDNAASSKTQQVNSKGTSTTTNADKKENLSTKIRVYPKGDQPPDPLSEIDPEYSGFFPFDPRTWISSNFQNFVLGETVRSFRILRGGFVKNHQLKTYEDGLCLASMDNVFVIDPEQ